MIATPATDPRAAAPAPPIIAPAPAATRGAARPPVSPVQIWQNAEKTMNKNCWFVSCKGKIDET